MEHPTKTNEDVEQSVPLKDGEVAKTLTKAQKLKNVKDNITVEPVLFFFMIASMISVVGFANLNLDKACRVNLNYNDSVCTALTLRQRENLSEAEDSVQKLVASVEAWRSVVSTVFPIIMMVFLGAWSDKMGRRKICMLLPIGGDLASSLMNIVSTYCFYGIPVEWTALMSTMCVSVGGSWYVMYLGTYSYLSDITTEKSRTFRMGLLTLCLSVSFPIGMGVSGFIVRYTGYYGVFGLTMAMHTLNFLYVSFRIKENIVRPENESKSKRTGCMRFVTDFFNWQSVRDLLQLLLKRRPNNQRMKLSLIMLAVCLVIGPIWGEMSIAYIMCRYRFNWDEIKYGIFSSYNFVVHTFGTLFAMTLFAKKLKMDDSTLGIIATSSRILGALVWALARNNLEIYMAPVAEFFDGVMIISLRAMASKVVTSQELGKVFSLLGVMEVVMMLILSPIYSRVYIATLNLMPGAAYFITAVGGVPALFIFIWFRRENKREKRDVTLSPDCDEEVTK